LHFATILAHLISLAIEKEELYRRIRDENLSLKSILRKKQRLVGSSPAAKELRRKIRRVATFDTTVLLHGESGTGKELVAHAIHDRSQRRKGPFIAVNCAAIPENLLESELFGYDAQSGIAGANPKGKAGKFELAHSGTLFLDEIGDMSLSTQAKMLRVLEERVVDRLSGQGSIPVDIRIIAATNKNLQEEVAAGRFREDLFYRLRVFKIQIPPLRARPEDILSLAEHFIHLFHKGKNSDVAISPKAQEYLLSYRWPGNVRELRNVIEEALLKGNGRVIYPEDLPAEVCKEENRRVFGSLAEVEARHLYKVLEGVNWNKRRASEILGINRSTLYEKIRLYRIKKNGASKSQTQDSGE
jgi:transcriptional regulator with PAS, ATPase and Fis domain